MSGELPEDFIQAIEHLQQELLKRDTPELRAHALVVRNQHVQTREEVERIEFLLGRNLTRGEIGWVHRRLHFGLQIPADAHLDFDDQSLDAAYRERLAQSDGPWRGPLDDIPESLRDLYPDS